VKWKDAAVAKLETVSRNISGMTEETYATPQSGQPVFGPDLIRGCRLRTSAIAVRCGVFTAGTMKNALFWDVTPCGSCKN
jgi:hypothetical protein